MNPATYRRFANGKGGEPITATTAQEVLPVILSTIQLRRTFADEMEVSEGVRVRIGSEIPPYIIYTVKLAMQKSEQKLYYRVHES